MFQLLIKLFIVSALCLLGLSACLNMPDKTYTNVSDTVKAPEGYLKAMTVAEKGETSLAIKLLSDTTKKHPGFSPAFTNLGLQHLKNKDYLQAESNLQKAIKLNPQDAVAHNHLGVLSRINGDFKNAKLMYQQAIKFKPSYANAHLNLGILLDLYLAELPEALIHYNKYQSLTSNSDKLMSKWIIDTERRIRSNQK